jgi:hypothetical protein
MKTIIGLEVHAQSALNANFLRLFHHRFVSNAILSGVAGTRGPAVWIDALSIGRGRPTGLRINHAQSSPQELFHPDLRRVIKSLNDQLSQPTI